MQIVARIPAAHSESLSAVSPECHSRQTSLDDGEGLGDSSSPKRQEKEEEEEVRFERSQAESEEWEWVDRVRD